MSQDHLDFASFSSGISHVRDRRSCRLDVDRHRPRNMHSHSACLRFIHSSKDRDCRFGSSRNFCSRCAVNSAGGCLGSKANRTRGDGLSLVRDAAFVRVVVGDGDGF